MAEDGPLSQADIDALTAGLLGDSSAGGSDVSAIRPEVDAILEKGSEVLGTLLGRKASMAAQELKDADAASLSEGIEGDGLIPWPARTRASSSWK